MYVGRIVSVCMTRDNKVGVMYRVSSRSFPNREAKCTEKGISIIPKNGYESDIHKNPYIAYNCLRVSNKIALATNGSHTDPIIEKIDAGMNMRDALVTCMFAMDYEHDQLDTPRISAAVDMDSKRAYLGIVRKDALLVKEFILKPGQAFYIATYEHNEPSVNYCDNEFNAENADNACDYILEKGVFADLERPITAACAIANQGSYSFAIKDYLTKE